MRSGHLSAPSVFWGAEMKYLKQITIILGISFISECMHAFIPLAVPANIYGIVILFLCLETGLIRAESVRETGKYLIRIMPVMFIPAGVSLMNSFGVIADRWLPYFLISLIPTFVVLVVTGHATQFVIRRKKEVGAK